MAIYYRIRLHNIIKNDFLKYNFLKNVMDDEWVDIKDYEGYYKINKLGDVKSLERTIMRKDGKPHTFKEMILKPGLHGKDPYRYFQVGLHKNGKRKQKEIHRLLALHFIPNPKNLEMVDHKNQNTKDNRLENLRWSSRSDNCINCKVKGKIKHKFICECKQGNYECFLFRITSRKEKNIAKTFSKKKFTLQDAINFRNKYCKENDIEIIE